MFGGTVLDQSFQRLLGISHRKLRQQSFSHEISEDQEARSLSFWVERAEGA